MKRLLLAGGGHAHLHVLKRLAAAPLPDTEVLLVTPARRQIYSGMVPGWMAGHYTLDQCAAALDPMVAAAGVRLVEDAVVGIDADGRTLHTGASGSFAYDVLSLDTGAGLDTTALAGSSAELLPIRPLERFVADWPMQLEHFLRQGRARLAVVGGGAAGSSWHLPRPGACAANCQSVSPRSAWSRVAGCSPGMGRASSHLPVPHWQHRASRCAREGRSGSRAVC